MRDRKKKRERDIGTHNTHTHARMHARTHTHTHTQIDHPKIHTPTMLLLRQQNGQLLLQVGQLGVEVVTEVLVLFLQCSVLRLYTGADLCHDVCIVRDQACLQHTFVYIEGFRPEWCSPLYIMLRYTILVVNSRYVWLGSLKLVLTCVRYENYYRSNGLKTAGEAR